MSYVRKKRRLTFRKKRLLDTSVDIDYKQPDTLKRFITDRGKIIPRRVSGASASQQRVITKAVKRARYLALVPFSVAHRQEKDIAIEVALQFASSSSRMLRHQPAPAQANVAAVEASNPADSGSGEEG